jgi:hypothetical protein
VSQPWAGVPVTISGPTNTIVNTDQTGHINVALETGNYTITTPDDATKYPIEQQITNFSEDADIGSRQVFDKSYPLDKLQVVKTGEMYDYGYINQWGEGLFVAGGEKDTLRTYFVNMPMDRYEEIRGFIRNINDHRDQMGLLLLEMPVNGSDNMGSHTVNSQQEETDLFVSLSNNDLPNNKVVLYFWSYYYMLNSAYTNANSFSAGGPHVATRGIIRNRDYSSEEFHFSEACQMENTGETSDPSWLYSIFSGLANTTDFQTFKDYRDISMAVEVLMGLGQKPLPAGTLVTPTKVTYKIIEF